MANIGCIFWLGLQGLDPVESSNLYLLIMLVFFFLCTLENMVKMHMWQACADPILCRAPEFMYLATLHGRMQAPASNFGFYFIPPLPGNKKRANTATHFSILCLCCPSLTWYWGNLMSHLSFINLTLLTICLVLTLGHTISNFSYVMTLDMLSLTMLINPVKLSGHIHIYELHFFTTLHIQSISPFYTL